jgi:hypothetical protein
VPYASKAQHRLFRALEARGQLARGTASRWYHETPHYASLPEYVSGYYGFGAAAAPAASPCARMSPGKLVRNQATGAIYIAGPKGECVPTGWNYATVRAGQCGSFKGINVCISDKTKIALMPTKADIGEGPPAPAPAPEQEPALTFWERYGGDIIVGTITAVTGAVAVYFAMRYVEKRR